MNKLLPRKAHALVWTLGIVVGAGVGARLVWMCIGHGIMVPIAVSTVGGTRDDTPTYGPILIRAGLDSNVLAAAGVSPQGVAAIVSAAASAAAQQASTIETADASVRSAKQIVDHLTRVVQAGAATDNQKSDLASAQSTLASATSRRDTALTAVFNAGAAVMSESQSRIATRIRANRAWGLPLHHMAANPSDRTEADWVTLREAIGCTNACSRCGEDVPSDATSIIAASEVVGDIAAAKTSLTNNAAAVLTAWNSAVAGG